MERRRQSERTRWWLLRPARNRKPATYRCPLCDRYLPALSEHVLLIPEGDAQRRRHAHTECVLRARRLGKLPTREEWLASQPAQARVPPLWRRVLGLRPRPDARDG